MSSLSGTSTTVAPPTLELEVKDAPMMSHEDEVQDYEDSNVSYSAEQEEEDDASSAECNTCTGSRRDEEKLRESLDKTKSFFKKHSMTFIGLGLFIALGLLVRMTKTTADTSKAHIAVLIMLLAGIVALGVTFILPAKHIMVCYYVSTALFLLSALATVFVL